MPKVLVAGEKRFFVHTFSDEELESIEINETRNDSVFKIGRVLDADDINEKDMETLKPSVIMLLKQSNTLNLKVDGKGFVVSFFRGKAINGKKNYIMNWLGKMSEEAVSHDPINLIPELVRGFQQHIQIKDYHKKSVIHQFVK